MPGSPAATALRAGFSLELGARGSSMWPLLRTGDWMTVEPVSAALRIGEIAVVETAHGLVAHRVISAAPLITRGDRMAADDPHAEAAALVGRVRSVRRWGIEIALEGTLGRGLSRLSRSPVAGVAATAKHRLARAARAALRRLWMV
jgi:hypothetical protein